jgi:hypothetical protein
MGQHCHADLQEQAARQEKRINCKYSYLISSQNKTSRNYTAIGCWTEKYKQNTAKFPNSTA